MKIQQISRFRIGEQGVDAGYQISGASEQVNSLMEADFTGMYTTVVVSDELNKVPYVLDCGYDMEGQRFYITQIRAEKDFGGRPVPYVHGLILDKENMDTYFVKPEEFFRFSSKNFPETCNTHQKKKEMLPEIDELILEDRPALNVSSIREKYHLTDEVYESLLRHMYEVLLSESGATLVFGWDQPEDTYEEVIKDMMFIAFSAMPLVFRKKITFSSCQVTGMKNRMFTVVHEKHCLNRKGAWFSLVSGQSSQLQEDVDGTRFKTQYITYLAMNEEEECRSFLEYAEQYLRQIYKRPDMKLVSTIGNAMLPAFYYYDERLIKTYFRATNAGKIMNSISRVKADNMEPVAELLGTLLEYALEMNAKINDVQFKNLQKFYLEVDSAPYGKAFAAALVTRDINATKGLFLESLKEKSSLKTDNFIAQLLNAIPDTSEVLTDSVVEAIAKRYPITESEELQDFYLSYVNSLYSAKITDEEASKLIKSAVDFVDENKQLPSYERAAIYLERQLGQLIQYRIIIKLPVLEKLFELYGEEDFDYGISESILKYCTEVCLNQNIYKGIDIYDELLRQDGPILDVINARLAELHSEIQDHYYCNKQFLSIQRRLRTVEDYQQELEYIRIFPVYKRSERMIRDQFVEELKETMLQECEEAYQNQSAGKGSIIGELNSKVGSSQRGNADLKNTVIYRPYKMAYNRAWELFGDNEPVFDTIRTELLNMYWDMVDIDSITYKFYTESFELIDCNHKRCEKVRCYWDSLDEFRNGLYEEMNYHPSIDVIAALSTNMCTNDIEGSVERVRKVIKDSGLTDEELSLDVLLFKYYDFVGMDFENKKFLSAVTEAQRDDIEMGYLSMADVHSVLYDQLVKYFLKVKMEEKKAERKMQKKADKLADKGTKENSFMNIFKKNKLFSGRQEREDIPDNEEYDDEY